jgi:tRNA-dihydrouridine synthase
MWIDGFLHCICFENLLEHNKMLILQAVIVRPLSAVMALVRYAEESQMFAIDFNDGCPMHVRLLSSINLSLFCQSQ